VFVYEIQNESGASVKVTNYGGIIMGIKVPDKNGALEDVILGYDTPEQYFSNPAFFGAICGRYANRIGNGGFVLNGKRFDLPKNEGPNQLHGGLEGFYTKIFSPRIVGDTLQLTYFSPDGEMGYPGDMNVTINYSFSDDNTLTLEYSAVCDRDTIVNLTNHAYFNLAGHASGTIYDHLVQINAAGYTPVDQYSIPVGIIAPVEGTPFDFRQYRAIGEHINDDDEQLKFVGGYDQNFALDGKGERLVVKVLEENSGRELSVYTDLPGIQFYSGNFIQPQTGKQGAKYDRRGGLCLETQYYPDSPNKPQFPSPVLKANETYHTITKYHFGVVE